jgi:hypothetical protein
MAFFSVSSKIGANVILCNLKCWRVLTMQIDGNTDTKKLLLWLLLVPEKILSLEIFWVTEVEFVFV